MSFVVTHRKKASAARWREGWGEGLTRHAFGKTIPIISDDLARRSEGSSLVLVDGRLPLERVLEIMQVDVGRQQFPFEELPLEAPPTAVDQQTTYWMPVAPEVREGWRELTLREGLYLVAQMPKLLPEGCSMQLGRSIHYVHLQDSLPNRLPHPAFLGREHGRVYLRYACRTASPSSGIIVPTRAQF